MPFLLVLGPIFGVAVLVACVAHAHKTTSTATAQAPRQFELDHDMPDEIVQRVLGALLHEDDPAKIEALANEISTHYPIATHELRSKAESLHAKAKAPVSPSPAAPGRGATHTPASQPKGEPDTGEAAVILQAAMRALTNETDPVELEGFAESIRTKYPTAAVLLTGRARELRASAGTAAPGVASEPSASNHLLAQPAMSLDPHHAAAASPLTYVVQAGDSPAAIAQRLVHDGKRWPELVALNPAKPVGPDGGFVSLRAGETLHVPPSWASSHPVHSHLHTPPKEAHA